MTTLRDAENATAGVPVVRGLEWSQSRVFGYLKHRGTGEFGEFAAFTSDDMSEERVAELKAKFDAHYVDRISSALNSDFLSELDTARAEIERLTKALAKIERWELPRTGRVWNDNAPPSPENDMSYGALYGSNGERDFMRQVARDALTAEPAPQSALTAAQARIAELERVLADVQLQCLSEDDMADECLERVFGIVCAVLPKDETQDECATLSPAVKEPK